MNSDIMFELTYVIGSSDPWLVILYLISDLCLVLCCDIYRSTLISIMYPACMITVHDRKSRVLHHGSGRRVGDARRWLLLESLEAIPRTDPTNRVPRSDPANSSSKRRRCSASKGCARTRRSAGRRTARSGDSAWRWIAG